MWRECVSQHQALIIILCVSNATRYGWSPYFASTPSSEKELKGPIYAVLEGEAILTIIR
jgi:hypothetical protein